MSITHRRSTPKVVDGRVQKKHRHRLTPSLPTTAQALPVVEKERAGRGYQHLLSQSDIYAFFDIVPDWDAVSEGLKAIRLAAGKAGCDGWYDHSGVVALTAWDRDLWRVTIRAHFKEHEALYQRLGVPCIRRGPNYLCKFTKSTARAYQLLHVFLHELGHHHDLLTTRSQMAPSRGESYAESWALTHEARIWAAYVDRFGLP